MSQKTLELPDAVYQALLEAAHANGKTPAAWIAERLPANGREITLEERRASHARLRQFTVSLGRATGIDNEGIDADLAREYGADHASLYRPDTR